MMGAQARAGTAIERIGLGTGQAIQKVYPPDAASDERFANLDEQLNELLKRAQESLDRRKDIPNDLRRRFDR